MNDKVKPPAQNIPSTAGATNITMSWYLSNSRYRRQEGNKFTPYFSGEEIFKALGKSIGVAKHTVDIVCWGFDPAMPLFRNNGKNWEAKNTYGNILKYWVQKNKIKVRLLLWYTQAGNVMMKNAVGKTGCASLPRPSAAAKAYSAKWYEEIKTGILGTNIEIRTRAIGSNWFLENEDPRLYGESGALNFPSDHQKSVMIDYGHEGGHGYLMGHNSLTDYWDTVEMKHDEPLREMGLKPYHDFSLKIEGSCMMDLNHNFCDAWDENTPSRMVTRNGKQIMEKVPSNLLKERSKIVIQSVGKATGQIVRTRPDKTLQKIGREKEIKRAYMQVAQKSRRYILIVNQFFQYSRWARHLKVQFQKAKAQGLTKDLYVFIFTCQTDEKGMLPRSHDMANEFGVSDQYSTVEEQAYDFHNKYQPKKGFVKPKQTKEELAKMGIHAVFCQLKTQVAGTPKEIYIHAKLTVIDDNFFTLGSANLNLRSMAADSEINLISDDIETAYNWRSTLFNRYSGSSITQPKKHADAAEYFEKFSELAIKNSQLAQKKEKIIGHAVSFNDSRPLPTVASG